YDQRRVAAEGGAAAAVEGGGLGGGGGAGQPADVVGRDSGPLLGGLGREGLDEAAQDVDAAGLGGQGGVVGQPLGEDDLEHRGQQPGVAVGPDGQVLEGLGRLRPAGVDDDHAPAPLLDGQQPLPDAGDGPHAAVGDERVGPDEEEEVTALEVGDGVGQRVAVEHGAGRPPVVD